MGVTEYDMEEAWVLQALDDRLGYLDLIFMEKSGRQNYRNSRFGRLIRQGKAELMGKESKCKL